ncbi:MAG: fused MFS/spermidine synthase [Candidatus Omnitrophica bacterium]|nr:fused MFS/spermidine synthase [Candidatus Omnitrophota bacterium]
MKKISLLNLLVFLSAFLLFQIELIAAKILLPHYGGSYMVWGACIVFFQAVLFAGYLCSHLFLSRVGMSRYRIIHLGFLLIPLLFFPGRDLTVGNVQMNVLLAVDVFRQLTLTIGPVFFVLSTISIVAQVWLLESDLPQRKNPYALYAWSNLGSFAALLTYPFVFEFFFDLSSQLLMWRLSYLVLIVLNGLVFWLIPVGQVTMIPTEQSVALKKQELLRWFFLSSGAVILFLAVTNIVTMAIAPFPLLWIIPLGIYLLAFVLNFKQNPWCPRWISQSIHLTIGIGVVFYLLLERRIFPVIFEMLVLVVLLFIVCMYCQNQLVRTRPSGSRNLTVFYLLLSLGGFVGGLAATWIVPLVSTSILEYVLGLTIVALAVIPCFGQQKKESSWLSLGAMAVLIVSLFMWPLAFKENSWLGLGLIIILTMILFNRLNATKNAFALMMILTLLLTPPLEALWSPKVYLYQKRNYYGICRVFDYGGVRSFMHGTTLHGMQLLDKQMQQQPTSYFGEHSPVGQVLGEDSFAAQRMAIVGLGAGTLAAYGRVGQIIDFYELDKDVYKIANQFFSFTKESLADIQYFMGDARLMLEHNQQAQYDVIIVDAFSGDSIPAHLLTVEMMAKYRERLSKNGIILFHVTNRYLKAGLVVGRSAQALNAHFCFKSTQQVNSYELVSDWAAVTWDEQRFKELLWRFQWSQKDTAAAAGNRLWTDQYSNMLTVVKYEELLNSLKDFGSFH